MSPDAAHALALSLVANLTGQTGQLLHRCEACWAVDHGQPYALLGDGRRVQVSLSRAGALIAAAAGPVTAASEATTPNATTPNATTPDSTTPNAAVGIDLERADAATLAGFADGLTGFADVACHPDEPRPASPEQAMRLWARKEAVLKALGTGLRIDPRRLLLTASDEPPAVLAWHDRRPVSAVELRDLAAPPGYVAALAVIGGRGAAYTQVSIRPATSASV